MKHLHLDNPEIYKNLMTYPLFFEIHAETINHEQYEMIIVAKSKEQADRVGKIICNELGLRLVGIFEKE